MANWYSDVFSSSTSASAPENGYLCPGGRQNYGCMVSTFEVPTTVADNDVIVFQPVDPRERLRALLVTADATINAATSITIDFGLYKLKADRTLGDELDLNLFASLVDIDTTAIARVDEFTESTSLVNTDRMKRIWELADVTLTLSPEKGAGEHWAICGQLNITGAVSAGGTIQVEAEVFPG